MPLGHQINTGINPAPYSAKVSPTFSSSIKANSNQCQGMSGADLHEVQVFSFPIIGPMLVLTYAR